jgi:hypothetical protein
LGPFRNKIKGKGGKKGRRSRVYFICGMIMIVSMIGFIICKVALPDDLMIKLRITYWAETIMLFSFGIAWMVAGKYFKLFVDQEDELFFFKK